MEVPLVNICACMIVKDEEENLPRCLESLRGAVDDVVVVDTGSTDRTVEIARDLGARVFAFPWCDDFAAARNESLRHAQGDWIIWVDADDELLEASSGALRRLCSKQQADGWGYWLDVHSPYGESGELDVAVRQWRLFPNHRDIWFRGRIHEEPWPPQALRPDQVAPQDRVSIRHWGYLPKGDVLEQKVERNRRLLEMCIEDEPNNPLHYYNLGRQSVREGMYDEASRRMGRALELWFEYGKPDWAFAHSVFAFAAMAEVQQGHFQKTVDIAAQAPDHLVSSELLCSYGAALWQLDRRPEAIEQLERAWRDPAVVKSHLHDRSSSTWHPLLMLAGLYDQTGRPDEAYDRAQRAVAFDHEHPEVLLALAYLAGKLHQPREEQLTWLRRLIEGPRDNGFKPRGRRLLLDLATEADDPGLALEAFSGEVLGIGQSEAMLIRAAAYGRLGQEQRHYDLLDQACRDVPDDAKVRLALATFLDEHGHPAEALNILAGGLDQAAPPPELYRKLSGLLANQGRLDDAANALEVAARLEQPPHSISACLIVRDEEANLPRCLQSLCGAVDDVVVVDTGSTDATMEIARQHGARVFECPWRDDFSAARNESLRRAWGEWILWIDADEALVEHAPGALRSLVAAEPRPEWGYFVDQRSLLADDARQPETPQTIVKQWRLFPNQAGIHFEGRIHEHPVAPKVLAPSAVLAQDAVHVDHWGYVPRPEVMARKLERNRRLIELSLATEPEQPRHYFNLGMHFLAQDQHAAALPVFRQGIQRWFVAHGADAGYVPGLFAGAARAAAGLRELETVLTIESQTPAEFVSSELLLETGAACLELGRDEDAVQRLTRAWSDQAAVANILHDPSCRWRALRLLARIASKQGHQQQARAAIRQALELAPDQPELLAELALLTTPHSDVSISACLIVRDEEANLPRCLQSLQGVVDELIVVDTGSADRTVEIAESAGAKVFHFDWCDDFSAARNESLRHASGDFILWIDADDELQEQTPGAVRRLCQALPESSWGYWTEVSCPMDEWGEGIAVLQQVRLFRNHREVRFQGRIHEQAAPPAGPDRGELTCQDEVRVHHWGYIGGADRPTRRNERNRRLLRLATAQQTDDNFHSYNLGLQYAAERDFEPALETLNQAIRLWAEHPQPQDGYVPALFSTAAMAAVELQRNEEAIRIEARTPPRYVSSELLLHAGIAWWRLGHPAEAAQRLHRAIDDPSIARGNMHDSSTSTWRPRLTLACIYLEAGDYGLAYDMAHKALQFAPTRPEALFVLAHSAERLGRREDSLQWARRLLAGTRDDGYKPQARSLLLRIANDTDDAALALEALEGPVEKLSEQEMLIIRARAQARLGHMQTQYETLVEGGRLFPEHANLRLELAELLDRQGFQQEALNTLAAGIDHPDTPAALYQRLATLLAKQGRLDDAANALQLASLRSAADASQDRESPHLASPIAMEDGQLAAGTAMGEGQLA